MTTQDTKEERFRVNSMLLLKHGNVQFQVASAGPRLVCVHECDLDVQQARALRDWLTEVLPS